MTRINGQTRRVQLYLSIFGKTLLYPGKLIRIQATKEMFYSFMQNLNEPSDEELTQYNRTRQHASLYLLKLMQNLKHLTNFTIRRLAKKIMIRLVQDLGCNTGQLVKLQVVQSISTKVRIQMCKWLSRYVAYASYTQRSQKEL